jgi:hypothetical protein
MRKLFIILIIIGIFTSCTTSSKIRLDIDVSNTNREIRIKNKKIEVGNNEYGKFVHGLYCKIYGKVSGVVEIELTNNEGTFYRKIISENGKINFLYDADFYDDEFVIKIISNNGDTGYINIVYKFRRIM